MDSPTTQSTTSTELVQLGTIIEDSGEAEDALIGNLFGISIGIMRSTMRRMRATIDWRERLSLLSSHARQTHSHIPPRDDDVHKVTTPVRIFLVHEPPNKLYTFSFSQRVLHRCGADRKQAITQSSISG